MVENKDIRVINYLNIFLSCITERGCGCKYKVHDHSLIYVCSGEVEINDRGAIKLVNVRLLKLLRNHAESSMRAARLMLAAIYQKYLSHI